MDEYNDEPSLMHLLNICIVLSNAQSTLQVIREKKIIFWFGVFVSLADAVSLYVHE